MTRTLGQRGVALMEAIVAGVIVSIGLTVLVSITANSLARQRLGEERIVAASLLDSLLSAVLTEGPEDFRIRQDLYALEGQFDAPFERYSYKIDIKDQGDVEPFLVTATVYWESGGFPREASVQTLLSQPRGDLGAYEFREPGEPISR